MLKLNRIKEKIAWLISVMLQPEKAIRVVVTDRGQITLEYFIIAAVLGVTTLVGFAVFEGKLSSAIGDFVDAAAKRFASS